MPVDPVSAALQFGPSAVAAVSNLFRKDSPEDRARSAGIQRLQQIAEGDPELLDQIMAVLGAQQDLSQSNIANQLVARGIDPRSGIARRIIGSAAKSRGRIAGQATRAFIGQQAGAASRLAGLPGQAPNNAFGDLLGGLSSRLAIIDQQRKQRRGNAPKQLPAPQNQRVNRLPVGSVIDDNRIEKEILGLV